MFARTLCKSALAIAVTAALTACPQSTPPPAAATPPAAQTAPAKAAPVPGIDFAGMDKSVQPGEDFNAYANGGWLKTAQIPDDRASTGIFLKVFEKAEQRTRELIEGAAASKPAAGSDAKRIADFYTAYMDTAGIEQKGITPLQPALDAIQGIQDKTALADAFGKTLRADVDPLNATHYSTSHLFGLFVSQGLSDPSHNMAYLLQGGLGMPDRNYYLSNDADMKGIREKYKVYIAELLKLANVADADKKAATIYALEEKIARAQVPITETEDVHKANNPWAVADLAKKAPGLDWATYLKAAGLDGQTTINAWQPSAMKGISALVASQPLDAWKDWLTFQTINENASWLPKAFDDLSFGFYGTTLSGTPKQRERSKRGLARVNADLGDAVGKLYVEKYFPASSRAEVQQLVSNLLAVFPERIDKLDWMTPETKAKAKAKVASIKVGVGYPDTWRDYSSLEIKPDDAIGNHQRAVLAETRHQIAKLGAAPDKNEWWMTPQTVNAVNLPLQNALNFPAAILEAPFFDPKADAAANYGSIGAVIGHEISHSFDNMGSEFDADGKLQNWWTPADAAHFKSVAKKLIDQYNAYEALPGVHLNGQQELGENIADLAGLAVAYDAYQKSLGGKPAPVIDGLTGDQRFFLAFAQSWREKTRDAALRAQVLTDGHAPGSFRVRTVRNIDAWYTAFGAKEGQALYLKPEDRIRIW